MDSRQFSDLCLKQAGQDLIQRRVFAVVQVVDYTTPSRSLSNFSFLEVPPRSCVPMDEQPTPKGNRIAASVSP